MGAIEEIASEADLTRLSAYIDHLITWNRKISLTSVPDAEIMSRLVSPSAWLGLEYSQMDLGVVIDFGSGPGIPGIPMAIMDSRNRYTLIDSHQRKIGFLKTSIANQQIGIGSTVKAEAMRIEPGVWEEKAGAVVTRGTGTLVEIVRLWTGKISPGGHIDNFKGSRAANEIEELGRAYPALQTEEIAVPDWFGDLQLIRIKGVK